MKMLNKKRKYWKLTVLECVRLDRNVREVIHLIPIKLFILKERSYSET